MDPSSNVDAERTENFVPEVTIGGRAKSRLVLKRRPGLADWGSAGPGPHRAAFEQNGRAFFVSGVGFYEGDSVATATLRGTVAYDSGPASIHGNGTGGGQVFVVSGGLGYIFTLASNAFAHVADPDFPTDVIMGFYINGHFGVVKRNSRTFAISDPFEGTVWSSLDLGEKSKTTDSLIGAVVDKDASELWLIGSQMSEVWWYTGAAAFPLEPVPNVIVPTGGAAPFSWVNVGSALYGLAADADGGPTVVRFRGYTPERISHHALESTLQGYDAAEVANARAMAVQWNGHRFYVLTFPNEATHVFDETTGLWTNWTYLNPQTGTVEPFLALTHMYAFGKHLMGGRKDGSIYEFTPTAKNDSGDAIRCVRRAPYLADGPKQPTHNRLWFDIETGVGLVSGQGSAPVGMVRWSDDGGKVWSSERQISLGALGKYRTIAELWCLGMAGPAGRVYELAITDPVFVAINDADVDLEAEAA